MSRKCLLLLAAACLALAGCNQDPTVRVRNERTGAANIQLQTVPAGASATLTFSGVEGGSVTAYQDLAAGRYLVHAALQGDTSPADVQFDALETQKYTIVVYGETAEPVLRVDTD
jgi:hypothetical protein